MLCLNIINLFNTHALIVSLYISKSCFEEFQNIQLRNRMIIAYMSVNLDLVHFRISFYASFLNRKWRSGMQTSEGVREWARTYSFQGTRNRTRFPCSEWQAGCWKLRGSFQRLVVVYKKKYRIDEYNMTLQKNRLTR